MTRTLLLLPLTLAFAACTTRVVTIEPATTVASTTLTSTTLAPTTTERYVPTPEEGLVSEASTLEPGDNIWFTDTEIVKFGWLVCDALGSGSTGQDVIETIAISTDGNEQDLRYGAQLAGMSIRWLCPEYSDRASIGI